MSQGSSTDLCGGRLATAVPTAILENLRRTLRSDEPKKGGYIVFFEIDLTQTVVIPKIPDQPVRPRASYVLPRFLLPTGRPEHRISPFRVLLESHDGKTARAILAKDEMKIEDMIWKDGQWTVNVTLGTRKFVFVREDGGAEWRGVDVSNE